MLRHLPPRPRCAARALAGLLLASSAGLVAGCSGGDPYEDYCAAVEAHQTELTRTLGEGGRAGLIEALPILADLRDQAPEDVSDEWTQVVEAVEGLRDAVAVADVDPATYDPAKPPAGLTAEEKQAIDEAATEVGSQETQLALAAVEQQVRDVCRTPLTL